MWKAAVAEPGQCGAADLQTNLPSLLRQAVLGLLQGAGGLADVHSGAIAHLTETVVLP